MGDVRLVADKLRSAKRVVALTGAGISTSAGIPDFRGPQGIYATRQYPPDVFDIERFDRDPRDFYVFARDFLGLVDSLTPTFTHSLLARLEAERRLTAVLTQNIDGLHQRAGSRNVVEIHGGFERSRCRKCRSEFDLGWMRERLAQEDVPRCAKCGGVVKPDIVFFGEWVKDLERAHEAAAKSDLLLVVGTSLTVYPAAGLPDVAGGEVVIVSKGEVGPLRRPAIRIDSDIDAFFREVDAHLAEGAAR
jgi:NAD-dependent deacetylase